jgi:hypothetical protein
MRHMWIWVAGSDAEHEVRGLAIVPGWGYRGKYRGRFSRALGCGVS